MTASRARKSRRVSVREFSFENLEHRILLATDLANLGFADIGNAGLIYQLSEPVPVDQRLEVLQLHTGMSDKESFQLRKVESDDLGFQHFRFQQLAYGIPVENGVYTVHARNGQIESISGDYISFENVDPAISLGEREAFIKALTHVMDELRDPDAHGHADVHGHAQHLEPVDSFHFAWQDALGQLRMDDIPEGELLFVQTGEDEVSPVWKFEIYVLDPLYKADLFVDANSGEILKEYEQIHAANTPAAGVSLFNGVVPIVADSFGANPDYRLQINPTIDTPHVYTLDMQNQTDYAQAVDVVSSSTFFNQPDHPIGVQTHLGAQTAVSFFSSYFNRNSFDANGAPLYSYFSYSTNYVNAFWNGSVLTFGDGDGVNYLPLVSLDVVGHEFSHGVIEWTADLIYQFESGALSESFADIFGEATEYHALGVNDWAIGSEIINGGGSIRGMQDPKAQGDPDTYLGQYWYTGNDDAGGVHTNGTVQNHWFYLLSEGGSGTNDNGDSYNVNGIGIEDAIQISYRNLAVYLNPASQYLDARVGSIQAAIDLFGVNSPQHLATEDAWDAVGVYGLDLRFKPELVVSSIGSLIYSDDATSEIFFDGFVDDGALKLDAGQAVSVQVSSDTVIPSITLKDPSGNIVEHVVGSTNETLLQSAPAVTSGEYIIEITGENSTTGDYSAELMLNASFELEAHGGGDNDGMGTAEDMDGTSIPLGTNGADRLGVMSFLGQGEIIHGGDDFESGTFGPEWSFSSSEAEGLIENWGGPGTNTGTQAMIMHRIPAGPYNLNEAILTADLSGITGSRLGFWAASWHEEPHYLPFGSYTGSANGDGVSLSVDGNTWYTMLGVVESPYGEYVYHEYDLDAFAASKGITLGSNVQFKFQQYDDYEIYSDGIGWDDIKIFEGAPSEDWYSFTLDAGQLATVSGTTVTGTPDLLVELFDSSGNLLNTGSQFDGQTVISRFTNQGVTDTFYVRVSGSSLDYSLIVTRDADYDTEPNQQANPQDITGIEGVLGSVFKYRQISAEPDLFSNGAILDNAFADLTLSNEVTNGSVWAADTFDVFVPPTGSVVFAPDFGAADGWRELEDELRVDFAQLQPTVSIDVGSDDSSDIGWLKAYNSAGALLEQRQTGGIPEGGSVTLTIDRPTEEIAYIVASGFDFHITPLDNLQYTDFTIDDDFYSVNVVAGEQLDFQGLLPGEGDFEFDNGLDSPTGSALGMELFDPAGNLVASDSELISHTAAMNGDYVLRVYALEGSGEYYISRSVTTSPVNVFAEGAKFLDGEASTSFTNVDLSDDIYFQLHPIATGNPVKQKIDVTFIGTTTDFSPSSFGFRVEASMSGGPAGDVLQEVFLFNEVTQAWDLFDSRPATNSDTVVDALVGGNPADYVNPFTGEVETRVVWTSYSFSGSPFNWNIHVDQAGWMIN